MNLWSPAGLSALRSLSGHKTLLAFDFDGTLAPLRFDPEGIAMLQGTKELLQELYIRTPVAVVSARLLSDLRQWMNFPLSYIIGNYGAEGLGSEDLYQDAVRDSAVWREHLKTVVQDGAFIEDKLYTLTIHSKDPDVLGMLRARIFMDADILPHVFVVPGKDTINLVPDDIPGKGRTVKLLMEREHCDRALYVGDDVADEDVFALGDARILSIRVGALQNTRASFSMGEQDEILKLLGELNAIIP